LAIVLSVLLRYTDSDYPCGIFWPLCCLFFFDIRILIAPVVSSNSSYNISYHNMNNSSCSLLIVVSDKSPQPQYKQLT
jgi:hypothetical protein